MKIKSEEIATAMLTIAAIIGFLVLMFVIGVCITTIFVFLICWAFGIDFSWKLAIGVYAVIGLLGIVFSKDIIIKEK